MQRKKDKAFPLTCNCKEKRKDKKYDCPHVIGFFYAMAVNQDCVCIDSISVFIYMRIALGKFCDEDFVV